MNGLVGSKVWASSLNGHSAQVHRCDIDPKLLYQKIA